MYVYISLCVLSVPLSELPSLLPVVDVAEALLHVRNGDWFMCLLVANVPDSFSEGKPSVSEGRMSLLNSGSSGNNTDWFVIFKGNCNFKLLVFCITSAGSPLNSDRARVPEGVCICL